ncbi:MAG: type II toxin-antitoxin system VapC family toxin [Dermatophilaceae bacterium]
MSGEHLFIDTTVLAHAMGGPSPRRTACQALVARAASSELVLHASTEAVQELLFHRMRVGDRDTAVVSARLVMGLCILHDVDREVMGRAIDLVGATMLGGREAVHAATALHHGFGSIVSADRDFDGVPGLRRVDPAELTSE